MNFSLQHSLNGERNSGKWAYKMWLYFLQGKWTFNSYRCVLAFNSVVFFSHYPNIITSVHMFRFYHSKIMTVMFLRYHCHIKWQAVVWCHPIIWWQFDICINNWTWWIIIHVLVEDLTGFLPLFLTFFFLLISFLCNIFFLC